MSLRKNLEHLRKEKKLSQEELAHKIGVSRQAVSKWESGSAYPETAKLITLCKMFDCTMDQLLQQDIAQSNAEADKKYSVNDVVAQAENLIRRTSEMIRGMNSKELFKLLFELFVLFIILSIVKAPFNHIFDLGSEIFIHFGERVGSMMVSVWRLVIEVVYFVLASIFTIYVYKIRFLDMYEGVVEKDASPDDADAEVIDESEQESESVKQSTIAKSATRNEIVIRNFGIFSMLGTIALLFIKLLVLSISAPILIGFLMAIAAIVVSIGWIATGISAFSLLMFSLAFAVFMLALIYFSYFFLLDYKIRWDRLFIVLITSALMLGVSIGIGALEVKEYDFTIAKHSGIEKKQKEISFDLNESTYLNSSWYPVEYVVDPEMDGTVRIVVEYYPRFVNSVELSNIEGFIDISHNAEEFKLSKIYEIFEDDLRNRKIHADYGQLFTPKVTVYSSPEGIALLNAKWEREVNYDVVVDGDETIIKEVE